MEKLKVGDKIYKESYSKITGVFTVERLTKTLAVCDNDARFKIEYSSSNWIVCAGGEGRWNSSCYGLETPELKEKYYRQNSIHKIRNEKYEDYSTEKIGKIMDIIKT